MSEDTLPLFPGAEAESAARSQPGPAGNAPSLGPSTGASTAARATPSANRTR